MKILAIETSCDETGIAILETSGILGAPTTNREIKVLADLIISQIDIHKEYGGVFPSLARREHAKNILPLIVKALQDANLFIPLETPRVLSDEEVTVLTKILDKEPQLLADLLAVFTKFATPDIDAIAVTSGPGLEPALWVGINTAQGLAALWDIPTIPVNHMEGHIMASLLVPKPDQNTRKILEMTEPEYPSLALLISGGHTELVLMPEAGIYKLLGQTRDDAVGEAFDKVARMLGLPYPGGPEISKLAEEALHTNTPPYPLPRPMLKSDDYDFSFSGLKTAVLYTVKKISELTPEIKASISKEFEDSVTEILVSKTMRAAEEYNVREIILGGGVTANKKIRADFTHAVAENRPDIKLFIPPYKFSTDNGLMIGIAGLLHANILHEPFRAEGTKRLSKEQ
jgi:N6-L-threonylcarbamoyladenine synthase